MNSVDYWNVCGTWDRGYESSNTVTFEYETLSVNQVQNIDFEIWACCGNEKKRIVTDIPPGCYADGYGSELVIRCGWTHHWFAFTDPRECQMFLNQLVQNGIDGGYVSNKD